MKKIFAALLVIFLAGCTQTEYSLNDVCTSPEGANMKLLDAIQIAANSECADEGTLTQIYNCNNVTGTWWIDMSVIDAEGCSPACVVSVEDNSATVNWRCTGLIQ